MEGLFLHIIPLTVKSIVVIPLMLFLRFLIRKQPKIYTYPLWIMVFLGLVFDINIRIPTDKIIINPVAAIQENTVENYNDFINSTYGRVDIHYESTPEYEKAKSYGVATHTDRETGRKYVITEKGSLLSRPTVFRKVFPAVYLLWSFVAVNSFMWFALCACRLDTSLADLKHHSENIYFANNISSPFVFGFFRPKIYIPASLQHRDNSYILRHERIHIRHRDNIIKPLCFLVSLLHWFNPLVWLCYRLMCIDTEMACDEAVIGKFGPDSKKGYATELLNYASGRMGNSAVTIMFGESHTEKRIKNILVYKKPAIFGAVAITAFVTVACIAPLVTTAATEKAAERTFTQQMEQVATIDHIPYRFRTVVFGMETADYWGNLATDGTNFATLHGNPDTTEKVSRHNQVVGSRVDDHPEGMFYSFLFLIENDGQDTFSNYYNFLNGESRGGGGSAISTTYTDRVATKVVSADYLSDDLRYEVFYSVEKLGGYGDEKHTPQLTIKKIYTTEKTPTEYLAGELNLIKDYNDTEKQVKEVYYLSADRVGEDVSSVRFLNENLGFLAHAKDGFTAAPQAMITLDGGATWLDLDFSDLTLPEKFSAYRSAFINLYGETIEIYLDVQYADGRYSAQKEHPYYLISYDCGKNWAGYLIEEKMEPEMGVMLRGPVRATEIIPAEVK